MMVLPNADADLGCATGRPVPIEVPKSPVRVTHEPAAVLDRQRLVEAVILLELVDDFLGRVRRHDRRDRIARRQMHQREDEQRHAEGDRHQVEQAAQGVERASAASSSSLATCHRDGREVLEPALGLDEALHLGAHRARVEVVRDIDPVGLVDDVGVDVGQRLGLRGAVEGRVRLVDQLVDLGVLQDAPVGAGRRHEARMVEAHEGRVGIDRGAADVDAVDAGLGRGLGRSPAGTRS